MSIKNFLLLLLLQPAQFAVGNPAKDIKIEKPIAYYLEKLQKNSTPLPVGVKAKATDKARLYLFWATWCEYCDQMISSLQEISNNSKNSKYEAVSIFSYAFDEKPLSSDNDKLKKMTKFVNFQTQLEVQDLPMTLSRLPTLIVEDLEKKSFRVYTGYSNERFKSAKKTLDHILNNPYEKE